MRTYDFYTGFEGCLELIVERRVDDAACEVLHAWDGYFDALVQDVSAPPGGWTGILLHYHLDTGWYDAPWIDPAPAHTAALLDKARPSVTGAAYLRFAETLIQMCRRATSEGGVMVWRME